jgi:hypothetical protein
MQQLLDKWERLRRSEYLRPDEKLMLNHCISDLKRFMDHSGDANEMVGNSTAVEWIEQEILKGNLSLKEILEQAKEMEREQIIEFARKYMLYIHNKGIITIETFYNETYGGNK